MEDTAYAVLAASPLFARIPRGELEEIVSAGRREVFEDGDVIPAVTQDGRRLGVVTAGTVLVLGAGGVPLNRIPPSGLFGAAALFGNGAGAPTKLVARKKVSVLFFTESQVEKLTDDPRIRKNLFAFLCDRIRFLNRKVATFSAADASEKLMIALRERARDGMVTVEGSLAQLARSLGLGRASLYRAMDRLEEKGVIRRRGRTIEILDRTVPEAIEKTKG
ncbi:MAG: Crp/Fnr family transcriptional regulator [Clostridia bacterium]|nr:Crp/Fnr family transcriptional regulator [Clostridia bacterium]